MIEFYAPWCPACKQLTPVYKELSDYSDELGLKFADCDITKSHALSGRFLITALPTLFVCEDSLCRKWRGFTRKSFIFYALVDTTFCRYLSFMIFQNGKSHIWLYLNPRIKYEGPRDMNTLHDYLQDEKWRQVEPLAWWR